MDVPVAPSFQALHRSRLYEDVVEKILLGIKENKLKPGDRLLPERELASQLGVSRATVSQALVALEVTGIVTVRHGDGTVLVDASGSTNVLKALKAHAERLPEIIDARDALETKAASLAAERRTDEDLAQMDAALSEMAHDIERGGRGVRGDELFHSAVTQAAHSSLLLTMMTEIQSLIAESRIESLSQPGRPHESLEAHRRIVEAVRSRDAVAAANAMHTHIDEVSDIALLRG